MDKPISSKSLTEAYNQQKYFLTKELKHKTISGYKAAVSNYSTQKKLGLLKPISGVLYAEGLVKNNDTLSFKNFNAPKIETEIGYIINKDIQNKITEIEASDYVKAIFPVLEIPNITKADSSILEVIAYNGFSSHYVIGDKIPPKNIDINNCEVKLYHNETLINTGKATDAMDDQWLTLATTINTSIDNGYSIKKGDIIITGALGNILPLEIGTYKAVYDELGTIDIKVK